MNLVAFLREISVLVPVNVEDPYGEQVCVPVLVGKLHRLVHPLENSKFIFLIFKIIICETVRVLNFTATR